jgi:hypothetical protein
VPLTVVVSSLKPQMSAPTCNRDQVEGYSPLHISELRAFIFRRYWEHAIIPGTTIVLPADRECQAQPSTSLTLAADLRGHQAGAHQVKTAGVDQPRHQLASSLTMFIPQKLLYRMPWMDQNRLAQLAPLSPVQWKAYVPAPGEEDLGGGTGGVEGGKGSGRCCQMQCTETSGDTAST